MLSEAGAAQRCLEISGYEMLKALAGITTHEVTVRVEVFPNTQDMPDLACRLEKRLRDPGRPPLGHAFLIAGHGLYAWGKDLAKGEGELDKMEDSTPDKNEGGIRFNGQRGPRDWLHDSRDPWWRP